MKKVHYAVLALGFALCVTTAFAQTVTNTTHAGGSPYASLQLAINNGATVGGDVLVMTAGTFNEAVTVNKAVTITGAGATTVVTPPSGIGITITVSGVTLQNLKVTGASGSGIYAANVANLTLTSVESDANGAGSLGSGVDVKGITGTSVFTDLVATGNHAHGLAIGNGSTGVAVSGGTFTGNGQTGDPTTGGGIILYADAGATTSGVSIAGTVNSNTNTTAGIYLECDPTGHVSNTTIGATGTVTLNDNGSNSGTYGAGGAAVLLHGPCDHTTITATSTNSNAVTKTAGLVVLGTDAAGANSPTTTVVSNSTLTGFNDANHPAGTMYANSGANTLICVNDVDATTGNTINGVTVGFQVEDALYHKVDDASLGLFRGPGTVLFVTPSSGSIQRAIDIANSPYSVTEVDVENGTYAENVDVNKAIILSGQGASTIIKPASGAPVATTVAGVTVQNFNLYLDAAFAPANTPTFLNNTFTFRTQAKVFLQGPYSGGVMNTTLLTNSLIPLSQPYNVAPFNYAGTETVASIPSGVVDWVLVELRSGTAAATKTAERAAFLKSDGTILETDGSAGVWESQTVASGYDLTNYVVIRHRNHLAVMSAASMAMPNASAYDFTTAQAQAFGTTPMKDLTGSGPFGMWAGDANSNGQVKYSGSGSDRQVVLLLVGATTPTNVISSYSAADLNLNGQVKYSGSGSDRQVILLNVGATSPTNVISTQVPN